MATSTTNYGLTKPAYNESADVAVINTNMDTIDEVMGKNQNLAKGAQGAIAIVADGDTHVAITAGQYVYVRNNTHSLAEGLYIASSNVSANANITSSNMTAVSGGGLNALNSNKLNKSDIVTESGSLTFEANSAEGQVEIQVPSARSYRWTAMQNGTSAGSTYGKIAITGINVQTSSVIVYADRTNRGNNTAALTITVGVIGVKT